MDQSPSETWRLFAGQEIYCLIMEFKLFYCIRYSVMIQLNPVHTFVPCFCNCWPGFKKLLFYGTVDPVFSWYINFNWDFAVMEKVGNF